MTHGYNCITGANLNDKNKEFVTPLHVAAEKSHYDVMDVLLKHGAKVNALDSAGQTCLHRCGREGNVQACRILLSFGADPNIVSLQGYTAAQLATDSVAKLLAEDSGSTHSPSAAPSTADHGSSPGQQQVQLPLQNCP